MKSLKLSVVLFSLLTIIVLGSLTGCKKENQPASSPSLYIPADTVIVNDMVTSYFESLKNKDFEKALSMLSDVRLDTVMPISDSLRNQLMIQYNNFPVVKYDKTSEEWTDIDPILMTYSITFAEIEGSDIPFKYNVVIQPIRKNGIWYLTFPGKLVNK